MPATTTEGVLWIDTSGSTNVLKIYKNGSWQIQELDLAQMDKHLQKVIETISNTLGSISDDNKLTHPERGIVVQNLADIMGVVPSTKEQNNYPEALPDYTVLDANGVGTFAAYRRAARNLEIDNLVQYTDLRNAYTSLITYLQTLKQKDTYPWDITTNKSEVVLDVDNDIFRQTFLDYYIAEQQLVMEILQVPGPPGAPAVYAILDNDSVTVPTKMDGSGGVYLRATTKMLIYIGTKDDTSKWTIKANISPNSGIVGKLVGATYTITSMVADDGYVELVASKEGYASISKRFSISKSKQGDTVTSYWIESDYPVIIKDKMDKYIPEEITITSFKQVGTGSPETYPGKFKIEESTNGSTFGVKEQPGDPTTSKKVTPSKNIKALKITLFSTDGRTQLDYEIVPVVSEGKDGKDAVSPTYAEITNDNVTITTDTEGKNGAYGGAVTTIHIYRGNEEVTSEYTITAVPEVGAGITGTLTGNTYKLTNMVKDQGFVDFIAVKKDHPTLEKRFTISKSKSGTPGKPATSRWLTTDTPIIRKLATGVMTPTSLTIKSWQSTGDEEPSDYTGIFKISTKKSGVSFNLDIKTPLTSSYSYQVPLDIEAIKVELYASDGITWLDEETLQVIVDGKDGVKGDPGNNGLSPVVGFLTNENISVQATSTGNVSNFSHVKGVFEVYHGTENQTGKGVVYSIDLSNSKDLETTINPSTGAYQVTAITQGTAVTTGYTMLVAEHRGVKIRKVLTVTKSMAGASEGDPVTYWIQSSDTIISKKLDGTFNQPMVTITAKTKSGNKDPQDYLGRIIVTQTNNGTTWTDVSNTGVDAKSVTFTPGGSATAYRAKLYKAGGTTVLYDEQTIPVLTDITAEDIEDLENDINDKTGTGLWKLDYYAESVPGAPELKNIRTKPIVKADVVNDFTDGTKHLTEKSGLYHLYTNVETISATAMPLRLTHNAAATVIVNGVIIYNLSVLGNSRQITLPLVQGWNTIDVLLTPATTGGVLKFDKLISENVVKMSSYFGGGSSAARFLMMEDEISLLVVRGEKIAGITIINDIISGAHVEINGDTTFRDNLIMDSGVIASKDGKTTLNLNDGIFNFGKGLKIGGSVAATTEDIGHVVSLSTPTYMFVGTDKAAVSGQKATTKVSVLKGDTPVAFTINTPTGLPTGMTVSKTANSVTFTVTSAFVSRSGTIPINIVVEGKTYTQDFSYALALKGEQGPIGVGVPGAPGPEGKKSYTHYAWANSSTGTSSFSTTVSQDKLYIGVYSDHTEQDSTDPSKYKWTLTKGAVGKGVSAIVVEQAISSSKVTAPTTGWQTSNVSWEPGKYVWTRNKITYTDPVSTTTTTPICDSSWEAVNEINVGTKNLLLDSVRNIKGTTYNLATYDLTETLNDGDQVTLQIKGSLGVGKLYWGIYNSGGSVSMATLTPSDQKNGIYTKTFNWIIGGSSNNKLHLYQMSNSTVVESSIEWVMLTRGNKVGDYHEAPEDLQNRIDEKSDKDVTTGLEQSLEDLNTLVGNIGIEGLKKELSDYQEVLKEVEKDTENAKSRLEHILADSTGELALIDIILEDLNQRWTTQEGFIQINGDETEMSITKGDVSMIIGSDALTFFSGGEAVATITNQYMRIDRGIFAESVHVGRHLWAPLASDRDHLILSYVGDPPDLV